MSDASNAAKNLRDRLSGSTEDRLGKALGELLESPLLTGAIGRAFDAREKAAQAQEVALGALNLPSAADIERLTRRLRSVSQRLEGIEDGVGRLDRAVAPNAVEWREIDQRLAAIEAQLEKLNERITQPQTRPSAGDSPAAPGRRAARKPAAKAQGGKPSRAAKPTEG
jgi:chromosome segregation ATPase